MLKYSQLINTYFKTGFVDMGSIIDQVESKRLIHELKRERKFDDTLFLDESAYLDNPIHEKINPGRGVSNWAEQYSGPHK
jgi:hypothetical protein